MSNGKPLPPEVRATRSDTQLIQNINRSIRSDWGGQDDWNIAIIKMKGFSPELDKFLLNGPWEKLTEAVLSICYDQIEGIRKRTSHDREELLRRAREREKVQAARDQEILTRIEALEKQVRV